MILDEIFQFLKSAGLAQTHAAFSTAYLGYSQRYYDYLRCSRAKPSLRCLVKLSGQLRRLASDAKTPPARADRAVYLSDRVMAELLDRCG